MDELDYYFEELSREDPAMGAAVLAAERMRQKPFSADELRMLMAEPIDESSVALQTTRRTLAARVFGGRNVAVFSQGCREIAGVFEKRFVERRPYFDHLRTQIKIVGEVFRDNLFDEAEAWADKQLADHIEFVLSLMDSPSSQKLFAVAVNLPLTPNLQIEGSKKISNELTKIAKRMKRGLSLARDDIHARQISGSEIDCVKTITRHVYGHVEPLLRYVLVSLYAGYFAYIFSVRVGYFASNGQNKDLDSLTLADNPEFIRSIIAHSGLMKYLPGFDVLGPELSREGAKALAAMLRSERGAWLEALAGWGDALDETGAQQKPLAQENARLQERLAEREKTIERLNKGATAGQVRALETEILNLRSQIDTLNATLAHKDELLAKRQGKPSPPPPVPKPAAAPVAPKPAPATVPSLSREDALGQLKGLRGVLVGGHRNFHNKITPLLPDWDYFDADAYSIDERLLRNAELVVFQTDYCSHKLTEGVLAKTRQFQIPVVYAYKVNPPAFLVEVCEAFRKISATPRSQ